MLPTPSTSHVSYDNIYEPAEDSFLMLDTLSSPSETDFLQSHFGRTDAIPLMVEIGTGSGVVIAFATAHASTIFGSSALLTAAVDINPHACKAALETVNKARRDTLEKNTPTAGVFAASMQADLTSAFPAGSIDLLVFNPPYVPSEESPSQFQTSATQHAAADEPMATTATTSSKFERDSALLALSYAGGLDGMETTHRFLDDLPRVLNPERGVAYLLLCAQNKPAAVAELIKSWGAGWTVAVAGHSGKKAGWEVLQILRICRAVS
jgi:release factor glutamine methyltransferase